MDCETAELSWDGEGSGSASEEEGLMRPHVALDVCRDQDRRRFPGVEAGSCMVIRKRGYIGFDNEREYGVPRLGSHAPIYRFDSWALDLTDRYKSNNNRVPDRLDPVIG